MHYPSLTKKLLLATILSVGATLPTYASSFDEGSQDTNNVQGPIAEPQEVAFDLDTQKTLASKGEANLAIPDPRVDVSLPLVSQQTESNGLFGWMFGGTKADTLPPVVTTQDEIKAVAQEPAQTTPSLEVLATPPLEQKEVVSTSSAGVLSSEPTPDAAQTKAGWSFNPFTLFGTFGSSAVTPQTPTLDVVAIAQDTPEEVKTSLTVEPSNDLHDGESAVEGEIWQPEPQETSSFQQAGANSSGVISHNLGFDPSQSTLFDLQAALAQVKEKKRSFTHSYPIESRLSSVTLPSGDLFSVYPAATYTLALGDIKIDFSGQELHEAIGSGKTLDGLALFGVKADAQDTTALFRIKDAANVSFVSADHLFFAPLKAGAQIQDTPNPFGLFFADGKSFTLGQDDLVTFKLMGDNFKTNAESIRRVGSAFVENFIDTYKEKNDMRVNRISRDGKFVYKRT